MNISETCKLSGSADKYELLGIPVTLFKKDVLYISRQRNMTLFRIGCPEQNVTFFKLLEIFKKFWKARDLLKI